MCPVLSSVSRLSRVVECVPCCSVCPVLSSVSRVVACVPCCRVCTVLSCVVSWSGSPLASLDVISHTVELALGVVS